MREFVVLRVENNSANADLNEKFVAFTANYPYYLSVPLPNIFSSFLSLLLFIIVYQHRSCCNVWLLSSTERLLHLDQEERRKEYRRQDFISLDKIPTWREENRCKRDSLLS